MQNNSKIYIGTSLQDLKIWSRIEQTPFLVSSRSLGVLVELRSLLVGRLFSKDIELTLTITHLLS
jgi:hypothetical protein